MATTDISKLWADRFDLPSWFTEALSVPREEGFVDIDGSKVHYFRWGKRGNPPLLMTHGFLAHARCFAFIAPFLAEQYDIVAYDLAGMGDSDVRPGCTSALRGSDMIAVANAFDFFSGPHKPTIIAHSFGAGVGLTAMEQEGERFAGLIICDLMVMRPEKLKERWEKEGQGRPGSGDANRPSNIYPDYETALGRYVLSPPQSVGEPFLKDYMAYHSLRQVDGGWTWKFDPRVFAPTDDDQEGWLQAGSRVAKLPHKTAIIYGENSKLFDTDSAAYIREMGGTHIPIIAVPEAEHHLMLDQPIAFVTALRSVLAMWDNG
ncbi:alpha/beta hydrolase [Parasphingorhabdus sp. JC815]|uniref:alpha/beta fold hydrolase n=1 Tax=Parasphingorhabdus sp. JC815 TaxID=3232140 RepID=UPI0034595F0C